VAIAPETDSGQRPWLISAIDQVSEWTGQAVAWLTLAMVVLTFVIVVLRYAFDLGSIALQEVIVFVHATVFLLGAAFTLQRDAHVRVDIFYQRFSPRRQALVEIWLALLLFAAVCVALMAGYPVAFTLAGVSLLFAAVGSLTGGFDPAFLQALPNRLYGIMTNQTLIAVPLFVFMGITLERSQIAESLLESIAALFGGRRGGLGIAVLLVGMLLAASTGIVGATVVTMV